MSDLLLNLLIEDFEKYGMKKTINFLNNESHLKRDQQLTYQLNFKL